MSIKDKIVKLLEGMNDEIFMDVFNDVTIGQEDLIKEHFIDAFINRGVNDAQYKMDAYLLTGAVMANVMSYMEKYYAEELSDKAGENTTAELVDDDNKERAEDCNAELSVRYAS